MTDCNTVIAAVGIIGFLLFCWGYVPWQIWTWCRDGRFQHDIDEAYAEKINPLAHEQTR